MNRVLSGTIRAKDGKIADFIYEEPSSVHTKARWWS
jgi:hypothetical protein